MTCDDTCQRHLEHLDSLVSGILTLLAIAIATFQVVRHLRNYSNPYFQNKIIIIIFMAPFYAFTSFLAVLSKGWSDVFTLIRDIYESILIYAFFNLLASYVAYDKEQKCVNRERIYEDLSHKGVRKYAFPLNYVFKGGLILISNKRGEWFFHRCKLCILQYLAIKPLSTLLILIGNFIAHHTVKNPNGDYATFLSILKAAVSGIVFVSVSVSMYFLILFYSILKEELAYSRPLLKLLSVKTVLFFTFWQQLVIEHFSSNLKAQFTGTDNDADDLITDLECILICFEMVLLAAVTTFAFSYKDFKEAQEDETQLKRERKRDLAKKLYHDVVGNSVKSAIEDLKDLRGPLRDPFKKYEPAGINRGDRVSLKPAEIESLSGDLAESEKAYQLQIHEIPVFIADYMQGTNKLVAKTTESSSTMDESPTKVNEVL